MAKKSKSKRDLAALLERVEIDVPLDEATNGFLFVSTNFDLIISKEKEKKGKKNKEKKRIEKNEEE